MFSILKKIFSSGPETDFAELVKNGAIILDVRSKGEYASGHIPESLNIPVDILSANLKKLKDKNLPIITCCLSGSRSATAKRILASHGYTRVFNGGNWFNLRRKLGNY